MNFSNSISLQEIAGWFDAQDCVPDFARDYYQNINTRWRYANQEEEREYTTSILRRMLFGRSSKYRQKNYEAFNSGWQENLDEVRTHGAALDTLKPRYYRGVDYLLLNNRLVIPQNRELNYDLAVLSACIIFSKHLSAYDTIYEFGCGSGLNIFILNKLFPDKKIIGLDWSENAVAIIETMKTQLSANISGQRFDLLAPDDSLDIVPKSALLTYTAMEQIGEDYKSFCDFIMRKSPACVVNWEPFTECCDEECYWSLLSHNYCMARSYLNGFYDYIISCKREGYVEILHDSCPGVGGEYYQPNLLTWKLCAKA